MKDPPVWDEGTEQGRNQSLPRSYPSREQGKRQKTLQSTNRFGIFLLVYHRTIFSVCRIPFSNSLNWYIFNFCVLPSSLLVDLIVGTIHLSGMISNIFSAYEETFLHRNRCLSTKYFPLYLHPSFIDSSTSESSHWSLSASSGTSHRMVSGLTVRVSIYEPPTPSSHTVSRSSERTTSHTHKRVESNQEVGASDGHWAYMGTWTVDVKIPKLDSFITRSNYMPLVEQSLFVCHRSPSKYHTGLISLPFRVGVETKHHCDCRRVVGKGVVLTTHGPRGVRKVTTVCPRGRRKSL